MIDHSNEQVKEELATVLHFVLHRTAAFESVSSSNDEREIVSAQLRVVIRCIGVRKAGRRKDGRALNA